MLSNKENTKKINQVSVDPSPRKQLATKLDGMQVNHPSSPQNDAQHEAKKDLASADNKEKSAEFLEEPLLIENTKRFVLFPIKYHDVSLSRFFVKSDS